MTWMLFAVVCAGCGPNAEPYGLNETIYLNKGDDAPFDGWLVSDQDMEYLLKRAYDSRRVGALLMYRQGLLNPWWKFPKYPVVAKVE